MNDHSDRLRPLLQTVAEAGSTLVDFNLKNADLKLDTLLDGLTNEAMGTRGLHSYAGSIPFIGGRSPVMRPRMVSI